MVPLCLGAILIVIQFIMVKIYGGSMIKGKPIKLFLMIIFFTLPTISNVIFSSYAGDEISIDDEEYLLLRESDVLATY